MKHVLSLSLIASLTVTAQAQKLVFRGSDTLGDKMVPALAEAYQKAGNATEFDIVAEGSSSAFKALLSGEAEIGMSSRPIKDAEKEALQAAGLEVVEHVGGIDMIAVIVNKDNKYDDLQVKHLTAVFTSSEDEWRGKIPIKAYTRDESSGTYKVFQKLAMGGAKYGAKTIKMPGNGEIAEKVGAEAGGIGYVGLSYANAEGVKPLKVNGVAPEPANAKDYPLSRSLYYYTIKGKLSPEAAAFLEWAKTSPAAAEIVTKVGFIPAK